MLEAGSGSLSDSVSLSSRSARLRPKMGYNLNRFKVPVNPGLICFLCRHVPEDPIGVKCCQTSFCHKCLTEWLQTNNTCPVDGQPLDVSLFLVLKFVVNSINELDICCAFAGNGCQAVVKVKDITDHEKSCPYNRREKQETEKSLREEIKEVKEENKLITEILKKQIDAFNEMRIEMNETNEKVEKLTQDKDLLKEEADLLRQELVECKREEFERRENERKNEKDAEKRRPEIPLFLASKEHENLVNLLKSEGVIKSDKVFDAMKAIDGRNYFLVDAQYEELKNCAIGLETWGLRLREGFNVLVIDCFLSSYYFPCLAEIVGEKGSVVASILYEGKREMVEKDHNYFLSSKRLTLQVKRYAIDTLKGAPDLSPFHLIIVCGFVNPLKRFVRELRKQLNSGGKIISAASGEELL